MFAQLTLDAEPVPEAMLDDDQHAVLVEFDSGSIRCGNCGESVSEQSSGSGGPLVWLHDESNRRECDPEDEEGTTAAPTPLHWLNSAGIHPDERGDSVTVTISVGDPRGAFGFTVRRIASDADGPLAGKLVMHAPYPGEPLPHEKLTEVHAGTYVIG